MSLRIFVAASLLTLAAGMSSVADAVDMNGVWRIQTQGGVVSTPQLVEITQAGDAVTFAMDADGVHFDFTGDVDGDAVWLTLNSSVSCPGGGKWEIVPGEDVMDGRFAMFHQTFCNPPPVWRLLATRCECVDGNDDDGDGCDATCRIEPCWSCSGTPSVCTPLADGAACDDRRDCTSATTCSAGACGAGSPVPACIDLTGRWLDVVEEPVLVGTISRQVDIRQRDGVVTIDEPRGGVGTIDTVTGAMALRTPSWGSIFCNDPAPFVGTASPDGRTYSGDTIVGGDFGLQCGLLDATQHGSRCGGGTLDPGEACDDGNADDGDGCDASCAVEPCWTCDETLGCSVAPRVDCRASLSPTKTRFDVRDGEPSIRDSVGWTWSKGAATTLAELGDPTATSDVALCVFDGSSDLLLGSRVPAGGLCGGKPCWRGDAKGFRYTDAAGTADGITKLQLVAGAVGKSKAIVRGKGAALDVPAPPFAVPVRVQLQVEGGACFESVHGAAGVRRNEAGIFKAIGTP